MLNRPLFSCLLTLATLASFAFEAQADETTPTQVAAVLTVDRTIESSVGLRLQAMWFTIPSEETSAVFLYAGPTWAVIGADPVVDRLFWEVSLKGVAALNFFEGRDGFGSSVASYAAMDKNRFSLFTIFDGYFAEDQHAWYGYYALDGRAVPWLSAGLHLEHVGTNATVGPQVGVTKGPALIEAQLHLGRDARALRLQIGLRY